MKNNKNSFLALPAYMLAAALLLTLGSCNEKKNTTPTPLAKDSVAVEPINTDTLLTKVYSKEVNDSSGEYSLKFEYPEDNDNQEALTNSIREWFSEEMEGTYEGDLQKPDEMVAFYLNDMVKTAKNEFGYMPKDSGIKFLDQRRVTKMFEAKRFVTYCYHAESYMGGAHGSVVVMAQTFRKEDGRRIGWEVFKSPYNEQLQKLIREGLIEYFSFDGERITEEQLADQLQGEANQYFIPLPQCPPIFEKDGIGFLYNQYEIACYAAGMPQFTIPYKKILPLMNVTGHRLLQ